MAAAVCPGTICIVDVANVFNTSKEETNGRAELFAPSGMSDWPGGGGGVLICCLP